MIIDRNQLSPVYYTVVPGSDKLRKIARLYAEVFADPPWNEYKKCSNFHYAGRDGGVNCTRCGNQLQIAYPEEETVPKIKKELNKLNGTLITFEDQQGEVRAAGWGFVYRIEEFRGKYDTEEMKEKAVKALTGVDTFFYISEVMVQQEARNQGLATRITQSLLERANALGLSKILRTHNESPMARIAERSSMVRIIQEGEDTEIEGRVLYFS